MKVLKKMTGLGAGRDMAGSQRLQSLVPWLALLLGLIGLLASLFCFNNARKSSQATANYPYQVSGLQLSSTRLRTQWSSGEGRDSMQPDITQFRQTHAELQGSATGVDLPTESARLAANSMQAFEQWLQAVPQNAFPGSGLSAADATTSEPASAAGSASLSDDLGYLTEVTAALRARLAEIDSPNIQIEPAGHLFQLSLTLRKRLIESPNALPEELRAARGPWLVFDQILQRIEAMIGTREITDENAVQLTGDIRSMQVALDSRLASVFSGEKSLAEAELQATAAQAAVENQQLMVDLATRHNLLDDTLNTLQNEVSARREGNSLWYTLGLLAGLLGAGILTLLVLGLMRSLSQQRNQQVATDDDHEESILLLLDEISRLAEGDLNTKATVTDGITGSIADSVNYAVTELRRLVGTMSTSAERVQVAVAETGTTARQLANASVVQSREISRSSAYTQAMANTMQQLSTRSSEASAIATRSRELTATARSAVEQTAISVQSVKQKTADANRVMDRLGDSSRQISRSIKLMDQVAEKTRLLAMNTAIRARGRGTDSAASSASLVSAMAEVAEQIQGLSNRLGQSAGEIETLVSVVTQDVAVTVNHMHAIDKEVDDVAAQAGRASESLQQIEEVSLRLDKIVGDINERTERQSKVIGQLSSNMGVINDVTRHSAHGLQLSASSLEDLRLMAGELKDSVAEFSLPENDQQAIRQRVDEIRSHAHVGAHSETMASRVDEIETPAANGNTRPAVSSVPKDNVVANVEQLDDRTIAIQSEIADALGTTANDGGRRTNSTADADTQHDRTLAIDVGVEGTRK